MTSKGTSITSSEVNLIRITLFSVYIGTRNDIIDGCLVTTFIHDLVKGNISVFASTYIIEFLRFWLLLHSFSLY